MSAPKLYGGFAGLLLLLIFTKEGKKRKRKVRGGQKTWEEKQRTGSAPTERQPKNRERKTP